MLVKMCVYENKSSTPLNLASSILIKAHVGNSGLIPPILECGCRRKEAAKCDIQWLDGRPPLHCWDERKGGEQREDGEWA